MVRLLPYFTSKEAESQVYELVPNINSVNGRVWNKTLICLTPKSTEEKGSLFVKAFEVKKEIFIKPRRIISVFIII